MANLTFPSNPTNGQKVTVNDKVFVYNSTTSRWTATRLQVLGNLTDDFTIAHPELSLSNNTVEFSQTGTTVYITYTVDQDVKASIATNGIANSSYANVTLHQTNNTIQITAGTEAFSGANVVLTVTNTRTSNTASIDLSAAYALFTQTTKLFPPDDSTGYNVNVGGVGNQSYSMSLAHSIAGSANILFAAAQTYDESNTKTTTGAVFRWDKIGESWTYVERLESTPTEAAQFFGSEINYSPELDRLVVGAELKEKVFVFDRDGATYTQNTVLQSPDYSAGVSHRFGSSIACANTNMIIGEYLNDTSVFNGGKVWLVYHGGLSGTWNYLALPTPVLTSNNGLGFTSATNWGQYISATNGSNRYIVATSTAADTSTINNAGAVVVYTITKTGQPPSGDPGRSKVAEIFYPDSTNNPNFTRNSVSVYSNDQTKATLAIGAPNDHPGKVYIYTANADSNFATWTQRQRIEMPTPSTGDGSATGNTNVLFGSHLQLNDDQLIITASGWDSGTTTNLGRVYAYERSGYGADFVFKERLTPDDDNVSESATSLFGDDLLYPLGSSTLFIGASAANNENISDATAINSGTTYVYN